MTLQGHITFERQIPQIERKDLLDYFPLTAGHYPGYIRRHVFRVKLQTIMERQYNNHLVVKGPIAESPLHPNTFAVIQSSGPIITNPGGQQLPMTTYKKAILSDIESETWFAAPGERNIAQEYQEKTKQYLKKAGVEAATFGISTAVEKPMKRYGGRFINKITSKKGKASQAVGNATGKILFGSVKVKPKSFTDPLIELSVRGTAVDNILNKASDKVFDTDFEGVDVSLNNETTRAWMTKTGMSEDTAFAILEVSDMISDFNPIATITKTVESVGANLYMAYQSHRDASEFAQSQQRWADLDKKIKADIVRDISALTDEELVDLYKLLTNK